MDFETFLRVARALEHENVDYALIGGVAVNLHGIVRATDANYLTQRFGLREG